MANAAAAAAPGGNPGTAKSSKKLLIFAIVGVVVLAAGGAGAWFFMSKGSGDKAAHAEAHAAPEPPVFMPPETFTVNLQPDGEEQYLQVGLVVQVKDQAASDKMKQYMPQVRSRLLMLLSSKKAADIMSMEGKNALSNEIIAQLKQPFAAGEKPLEVTSVHFTDFIIQ